MDRKPRERRTHPRQFGEDDAQRPYQQYGEQDWQPQQGDSHQQIPEQAPEPPGHPPPPDSS